MNSAATVVCVYYKVEQEQHAAIALRVRAFQVALMQAWPGLVCELLQRPAAAAGIETWMETYRLEGGHAVLGAERVDAIARAALEAALPAPRHSESFIPLR